MIQIIMEHKHEGGGGGGGATDRYDYVRLRFQYARKAFSTGLSSFTG